MKKYTTGKGTIISKSRAIKRAVAGKSSYVNGKKIKCVEWKGNRYCDKGSRTWVKKQQAELADPKSSESIARKQYITRLRAQEWQKAKKKAGIKTLYEKCVSSCTCKYNPHIVGWHKRRKTPIKAFKRYRKACKT